VCVCLLLTRLFLLCRISVVMSVYPDRHLPTPGQHGHSPQRHTAAGTAAPTTADTENTVPQRANTPPWCPCLDRLPPQAPAQPKLPSHVRSAAPATSNVYVRIYRYVYPTLTPPLVSLPGTGVLSPHKLLFPHNLYLYIYVRIYRHVTPLVSLPGQASPPPTSTAALYLYICTHMQTCNPPPGISLWTGVLSPYIHRRFLSISMYVSIDMYTLC